MLVTCNRLVGCLRTSLSYHRLDQWLRCLTANISPRFMRSLNSRHRPQSRTHRHVTEQVLEIRETRMSFQSYHLG